jgi:hypothetical protein
MPLMTTDENNGNALPLIFFVVVITIDFVCRRHYHCFRLSSSLPLFSSVVVIAIAKTMVIVNKCEQWQCRRQTKAMVMTTTYENNGNDDDRRKQ